MSVIEELLAVGGLPLPFPPDSIPSEAILWRSSVPGSRVTALAWSDISGKPSTFAPSAHASLHGSGKSDEVSLAASQITSGEFDDARVAESNVTQYEDALTILETQITDGALLARLAASEIVTGQWTFSGDANAGYVFHHSLGSGSSDAIQEDDQLFALMFGGYNGTSWVDLTTGIYAFASSDWDSVQYRSRLEFWVAEESGLGSRAVLKLNYDGSVEFVEGAITIDDSVDITVPSAKDIVFYVGSNQAFKIQGSDGGATRRINAGTLYHEVGAGSNGILLLVAGTLKEAASGTHARLVGTQFSVPAVTAGGATVTDAATVYIAGAPTATVSGANYALWVDAGVARFDGNVELGSGSVIKINNIQVVGAQQSFIADPAGGGTQDVEARAAIGAILDLLEAHGLMAAS